MEDTHKLLCLLKPVRLYVFWKETYGSTQAQSKREPTIINRFFAQNLNTAVQFGILNASAVARMVNKQLTG